MNFRGVRVAYLLFAKKYGSLRDVGVNDNLNGCKNNLAVFQI